jgi:TM2 domain-containing membrane protein YozV
MAYPPPIKTPSTSDRNSGRALRVIYSSAQILPCRSAGKSVPKWKDIARLSAREEKSREAAFEAQTLAAVAADKSKPSVDPPAPPVADPPPSTAPVRDAIQISVTENGQTTRYDNLETVPSQVRQRILSAWRPAPHASVPPTIRNEQLSPPPTHRPRTLRVAMALNLLLPGAGQFYLGQPVMGSVYALGFLACLGTMLVAFFRAYVSYFQLSTSGDIMAAGDLEQLTHAFPIGLLVGLSAVGIVIYLASTIHLALSRRKPPV